MSDQVHASPRAGRPPILITTPRDVIPSPSFAAVLGALAKKVGSRQVLPTSRLAAEIALPPADSIAGPSARSRRAARWAQRRERGRAWHLAYFERFRAALEEARALVVVPRPDGTVGAGVLEEIRLAGAATIPVLVLKADGKGTLVPLLQAGLHPLPTPEGAQPDLSRAGVVEGAKPAPAGPADKVRPGARIGRAVARDLGAQPQGRQ